MGKTQILRKFYHTLLMKMNRLVEWSKKMILLHLPNQLGKLTCHLRIRVKWSLIGPMQIVHNIILINEDKQISWRAMKQLVLVASSSWPSLSAWMNKLSSRPVWSCADCGTTMCLKRHCQLEFPKEMVSLAPGPVGHYDSKIQSAIYYYCHLTIMVRKTLMIVRKGV